MIAGTLFIRANNFSAHSPHDTCFQLKRFYRNPKSRALAERQGRLVKLVIALGKGEKNYDKRETLKRRDQDREAKRMMSNR